MRSDLKYEIDSAQNLKPCPFCGDENNVLMKEREVQCDSCGAIGPTWNAMQAEDEEKRIQWIGDEWNARGINEFKPPE